MAEHTGDDRREGGRDRRRSSLLKSVERLRSSRIDPDYFWFEGHDLKVMFDRVNELGPENIRLKAHPGLTEQGHPDLWFEVVDKASGTSLGHYNASHPCPIWCPD